MLILADHPILATAFGTDATFLAMGEMGGRYQDGGDREERLSDDLDLQFDPAQLPSGSQDLLLGVYRAENFGSDGQVNLGVSINGDEKFLYPVPGLDNAANTFNNYVYDLGPVSSFGSGSVSVNVSLDQFLETPQTGFFAGLVLGTTHA